MEQPAIGIDLGTTYCCVAVFEQGKVNIVCNESGYRTTPSYVAFTETERLIGDTAKNQMFRNPVNTVYDAKRLIGKKMNDDNVHNDMLLWPFQVINGEDDKPAYKVKFKNEDKLFYAEEISGMVLSKLKSIAETYLNRSVTDVVVTVPAYFNDAERQATRNAGIIAGINITHILNEPTSAALAYGFERRIKDGHVLVYDLGGGTLDISILKKSGDLYEVKATDGNTHLGGQDIDKRLVEHLAYEFELKTQKDMMQNKRSLRRLQASCEKAKRELSFSNETHIELDALYDGDDLYTILKREKFEELNKDLFEKTLISVENALNGASLKKEDIDEILLVGGSTRIPYVQKMISNYFDGRCKLTSSINPDEAVAYGAAIQASLLLDKKPKEVKRVKVLDVTPHALGIRIKGGEMSPIVLKNASLPAHFKNDYTTSYDNQTEIFFEGEKEVAYDNVLLGTFTLGGIEPAEAGVANIQVNFIVNEEGILTAEAVDLSSFSSKAIKINTNLQHTSSEMVTEMIRNGREMKAFDRTEKERKDAMISLETFLIQSQSKLNNFQIEDNDDLEKHRLGSLEKIAEAMKWMNENPTSTKSEFDGIQLKIYSDIDDILHMA